MSQHQSAPVDHASAKVEGSFNWADPRSLGNFLSEEERLISDTARDYCQQQLLPRMMLAHRNETFDVNIMREMGELGLLGSTLPAQYEPDHGSDPGSMVTRARSVAGGDPIGAKEAGRYADRYRYRSQWLSHHRTSYRCRSAAPEIVSMLNATIAARRSTWPELREIGMAATVYQKSMM